MTVFHAIVELTRASWHVFRRHPRLAWFPILSLVSVIVVFILAAPLLGPGDDPPWLAVFLIGFLAHLTQVFFSVGLTHEALRALRGETPSMAGGLSSAFGRAGAIVSYTAVTSTVGFFLGVIGRSSRVGLRIARAVIGTAWSLATYLAIPVMVKERRGGVDSLRRSGELFRRTWGETTLSEVGLRVITAHLTLMLVIVALVLIKILGDSPLTILVIIALAATFVGVIGSLEAIYRAALYVFAAEGVVPEPFAGPQLDEVWKAK